MIQKGELKTISLIKRLKTKSEFKLCEETGNNVNHGYESYDRKKVSEDIRLLQGQYPSLRLLENDYSNICIVKINQGSLI